MLIRQLRENEAHKSAALMAAAFGFNTNIDEKREENLTRSSGERLTTTVRR